MNNTKKRKSPDEEEKEDPVFNNVFGPNSVLGPENTTIKVHSNATYSNVQMMIARWMLLQRMTQCQICELRCFKKIKPCLVLIRAKNNGNLYAVKKKTIRMIIRIFKIL